MDLNPLVFFDFLDELTTKDAHLAFLDMLDDALSLYLFGREERHLVMVVLDAHEDDFIRPLIELKWMVLMLVEHGDSGVVSMLDWTDKHDQMLGRLLPMLIANGRYMILVALISELGAKDRLLAYLPPDIDDITAAIFDSRLNLSIQVSALTQLPTMIAKPALILLAKTNPDQFAAIRPLVSTATLSDMAFLNDGYWDDLWRHFFDTQSTGDWASAMTHWLIVSRVQGTDEFDQFEGHVQTLFPSLRLTSAQDFVLWLRIMMVFMGMGQHTHTVYRQLGCILIHTLVQYTNHQKMDVILDQLPAAVCQSIPMFIDAYVLAHPSVSRRLVHLIREKSTVEKIKQ